MFNSCQPAYLCLYFLPYPRVPEFSRRSASPLRPVSSRFNYSLSSFGISPDHRARLSGCLGHCCFSSCAYSFKRCFTCGDSILYLVFLFLLGVLFTTTCNDRWKIYRSRYSFAEISFVCLGTEQLPCNIRDIFYINSQHGAAVAQ